MAGDREFWKGSPSKGDPRNATHPASTRTQPGSMRIRKERWIPETRPPPGNIPHSELVPYREPHDNLLRRGRSIRRTRHVRLIDRVWPNPGNDGSRCLSKPNAEQAAIFGGISQACCMYIVIEIEVFDGFFERVVFIHRHDVLKTKFTRNLGAKTQRANYLATINAIKEVAVMDQKSRSHLTLGAQ